LYRELLHLGNTRDARPSHGSGGVRRSTFPNREHGDCIEDGTIRSTEETDEKHGNKMPDRGSAEEQQRD
jgi:hypothetical protein